MFHTPLLIATIGFLMDPKLLLVHLVLVRVHLPKFGIAACGSFSAIPLGHFSGKLG